MRSTERAYFQLRANESKKPDRNIYDEYTVVVRPRSDIASPTGKSTSPQSIKSPSNFFASIPGTEIVKEIPKGQEDVWIVVEHTAKKFVRK